MRILSKLIPTCGEDAEHGGRVVHLLPGCVREPWGRRRLPCGVLFSLGGDGGTVLVGILEGQFSHKLTMHASKTSLT